METNLIIDVPKNRIGNCVGKKGLFKKILYRKFKLVYSISSRGTLNIHSTGKLSNQECEYLFYLLTIGYSIWTSVRAIKENSVVETIKFASVVKGNSKKLHYAVSNLIGTKGMNKQKIERMSDTQIVIKKEGCWILGNEEGLHTAYNLVLNKLYNKKLREEEKEENGQ